MTNLVIDFPQALPAGTVLHVQVDDRVFDVSCPAQISPPNFARVAVCTDRQVILYFDLMVPAAVHAVSVSAALSDGSPLFAALPTTLGEPAMLDPDAESGLCFVPVAVMPTGHAPATAPPAGSESCAAGPGTTTATTVTSFAYGTTGPVTLTGLQISGGSVFTALTQLDQGTYDVASAPLPCGLPTTLASAAGTVIGGPIVAAGSVFWATADGVLTVPAAGGPAQVVAPGPLAAPVFFAASAEYLAWIDLGGTVQRLGLAGGPATVMAAGWGAGAGVAVDETDIYFSVVGDADWGAGPDYGRGGSVLRVPVTGGDVAAVAANQQAPRDLVLGDGELYWASPGTHSGDVPASSAGNPDGLIVRQSLSGGAPIVLASGETNPGNLHLLGAAPLYPILYWTAGGLGLGYTTREMPAAGGTPVTALGGQGLAFDADRVYWWEPGPSGEEGNLSSALVLSAPR